LKKILEKENLLTHNDRSKNHFFVSDFTNDFQKSASRFYDEEVILERVELASKG